MALDGRDILRWGGLIVLSVICEAALSLARLPGSLLLGPMIAGIAISLAGSTLRVPTRAFRGGQAIVGCVVASTITPDILTSVLADWPLLLAVVTAIVLASGVVGWLLARWGRLPGTTAVWGTSAGGAAAMMLMAGHYGADVRMVAFMQYLRVLIVAGSAGLVGRLAGVGGAGPAMTWFPPLHPVDLLITLAIAFGGGALGHRLRLPAGGMLLPMMLGAVLHGAGLINLELPGWLLTISYAIIGWNVGLGFTRPVLVYALRALPHIILSIATLMGFCTVLAWLLVLALGVDPLTAYLATSPGGMDSVAVIAASSNVDAGFVMAMQVIRLLATLAAGPSVARFVANRVQRHA